LFLIVRGQVPHPYTTTDKIWLHVFIIILLNNKRPSGSSHSHSALNFFSNAILIHLCN
jgi:hypothetical protein